MIFKTKLWKRGQNSYATTIPHVALLNLDLENQKYNVVWDITDKGVRVSFVLRSES